MLFWQYLLANIPKGILFGILHTCSNFGLVIVSEATRVKSSQH